MFKNIANAFRIPDIRKRLLFTALMVLLVRFGCQIATPGVNVEYMYAFSVRSGDKAVLVFRFDKTDEAEKALEAAGFRLLDEKTL